MSLSIDVYLSEHCGSYYQLRENLERAIAELHVKAEVAFHTFYYDDAVSRGIKGSPSIWIKGKDIFPSANDVGLT